MERTRCLIALGLFVGISCLAAEFQPYHARIYNAYLRGDMQAWDSVVTEMEQRNSLSNAEQWELLDYYYGQIGRLLEGQPESAAPVLKKASDLLLHLTRADKSDSRAQSYEAGFLGFRSALATFRGPLFGMRSMRMARRAVEDDPSNPLAWVEFGQVIYHAPAIAGGNKQEATAYFEKAFDLMEKQEYEARKNWRILHVARILHGIYTRENREKKAQDMERYLTSENR